MHLSSPSIAQRVRPEPPLKPQSRRIYDIDKLYVTTKRDFAHAWAICVPEASLRPNLQLLFGIQGTAYYEVDILNSAGQPLSAEPEADPDYPGGGSFQVDAARVLAVHRPKMGLSAALAHLERMASAPPPFAGDDT